MRIVLDTNVFVSGIFFGGPPCNILDAWRRAAIQIVLSPEILDEYRRVGDELAERFSDFQLQPLLDLLTVASSVIDPPPLPAPVCRDPDDDKFLACAVAARTKIIVSGDKALLETSGYAGIAVLTPRQFVDRYLRTV